MVASTEESSTCSTLTCSSTGTIGSTTNRCSESFTCTNADRPTLPRKKLRFGAILIWDMPMELGNHPPTSGGAPVTIGWEHISCRTTSVDLYELIKEDEQDTRREGEELRLSVQDRSSILWRAGYRVDDILNASQEAEEVLTQRDRSSRDKIENWIWFKPPRWLKNEGKTSAPAQWNWKMTGRIRAHYEERLQV